MRRILATAVLALVVAACDGGTEPPPSPTPTRTTSGPSPSVSPTASASPSGTSSASPSPTALPAALQLPADAPVSLEDPAGLTAVAAGDFAPLVPPGASVTHSALLVTPEDPVDQIALTWRRGEDPFAAEQAFVVWQRFEGSPPWRAVYAFTDKTRKGVLGIDLETDDLTGDGIPDALTIEQRGGSGACGTWRVIVSTPGTAVEVFRRSACDTEIRIASGGLSVREAVYVPDDPHCCPSAFRNARLEWDGKAFVETSSEVVDIEA
jgi:hypothetical protein